jgi:hypothetical protein
MMLLTDGETKDKTDVMPNLKKWKDQHERLPCSIYTFGIGYEIDSELLIEVSHFADGSYAFIPDAGFVGTIFVNTISCLMVTMGKEALLTLESEDLTGTQIEKVAGNWSSEVSADGIMRINLGQLQYDQTKDVVLKIGIPSGKSLADVGVYLAASLEYNVRHGPDRIRCQAEGNTSKMSDAESTAAVERQRCRALLVDAMVSASSTAKVGNETTVQAATFVVQAAATELQKSPQASHQYVKALLEDSTGQTSEALSRHDWWKKWGRHYLPSIAFAHKLQQCNNFKDPGVQEYGGVLFNDLRDQADEVFSTLSAPKPTVAQWRYLGTGQLIANPDYVRPGVRPTSSSGRSATAAAPARPPINMAAYNDANAG